MRPIVEDILILSLSSLPLCGMLCFGACASKDVDVANATDVTRALERSIEDYCDGLCVHETCDGDEGEIEECMAECMADEDLTAHWSNEYVVTVGQCLLELPCEGKDDDCYEDAVDDLADPDHELTRECLARLEQCTDEEGDGSFSNDYCTTLLALTDESRRRARDCFELDCDYIGDCLRNQGAFRP